MIPNKVIDARNIDKVRGAKKPIDIIVRRTHCAKAKPGDPERCALVIAAKEEHQFESFVVHRTVAYGRYKGKAINWRWQNSAVVKKFVEQFDKGDYSAVPDTGLRFHFMKARKNMDLDYLRSPTAKAIRNASAKKNKGKKPRAYRLPDPKTLAGVRNRFGFHDDDGEGEDE
jgi:hypothetical protein